MQKLKGEALLFAAALIWGSAFLFQKVGMDYIGPMAFTMFRFGLGALAVLPVAAVNSMIVKRDGKKRDDITVNTPYTDRTLLLGGFLIGLANFAGSIFQQIGIVYTTIGKAGFITAMDLVIVPFILVLIHKKVHPLTWTGVAVACAGMYFLSMTGGFRMEVGDALCFAGAFGFAVQIVLIDWFADKVDCFKLAFYEFFVTFLLSAIATLIFESVEMELVLKCAGPIIFTGILEVCVAFTLQIVGLKYAPPAIGTIIMSMESVFAALAGVLFLGEVMTGRQTLGCIIMLAAFIIAQIPEMRSTNEEECIKQEER